MINQRRTNTAQFFPAMDAPHQLQHHDAENFDFFVGVDRMGEAKQKGLSKSGRDGVDDAQTS